MTPAEYTPLYDDSIVEMLALKPEVGVWPMSQYYCLTFPSARILATFFNPPPAVMMGNPIRQAQGSPFTFNRLVPWLRFTMPDGSIVERNAGQMAIYWGMPGVPDPVAECLLDINTLVEGQ